MFLPSVENRRYRARESVSDEGVLAGEHSQVETCLYKFSTSLPRYKVGKFSKVCVTGKPEIAAVSLGDFADLTVANNSLHKDVIVIQGGDCCRVVISNAISSPAYDEPAFTQFDCERPSDDTFNTEPLYTGFFISGDSFTAVFKESGMYGTKYLELYFYSHRGDLSLYMRDRKVFTLKAGEAFWMHFGESTYTNGRTKEENLFKQLRKRFFDVCLNNRKKNQTCKSVVA